MAVYDCIFCKIIAGTVPAETIVENDDILVIKDIFPKAPIHYLIIPKKHIKDIRFLEQSDTMLASNILAMAQQISVNLLNNVPFRLISNNGADAGQKVFHIHFHFIAGHLFSDY